MQQHEPLHFDRHGASLNLNLILALGVTIIGVLMTEPLIVVVGLVFAGFAWLTTPSMYAIYVDRLIISYGRPRVRHVPFREIAQIQPVTLPMGIRLLIRLRSGRRFLIQPKDAEVFSSKFSGALQSFNLKHGGEGRVVDVDMEEPPPSEEG